METAQRPREKTIIRTAKDRPWMATLRVTPQDKTLSYEAAGMLWYLLSKPDDWKVIISDLERPTAKRDKVYRILKELKEKGYIHRARVQNVDGTFTWDDYRVYEVPVDEPFTALPDMVKPNIPREGMSDLPDTAKPTLHNSDSTETLQKDSAPENVGAGAESQITTETQTSEETGLGAPIPPDSASSPEPEKPTRPRNLIFDAVAEHVFGFDEVERDHLSKEDGGQIGVISAWLAGTSDRWTPRDRNGKALKPIVKGFISAPAKPEHIKEFSEDWKTRPGEPHMPLAFETFVNHWRAWASAKRKAAVKIKTIANAPLTTPPPQLTEEEIQQRVRDLAEARERQTAARRQGVR